MSPDSVAVELLAIAAAIVAAAGLSVVWAVGSGWRRTLLRSAAIIACLATASASGLLWVNRQIDFYPTWSSLFGPSSAAVAATDPGHPAPGQASGQIISFTPAGKASGLTLPVYVYLPPGYAANPATRFPVIEAMYGYPGSPLQWVNKLRAAAVLDQEIATGRMAPTIVLFPYQTPAQMLDTECTNLVNGAQAETFLTVDVPAAARAQLRVRTDAGAWGLIGFSAGGYCATNLALRHPTEYSAAASLSGYVQPGIRVGNGAENTDDNDLWRLKHLPVPAVALYLACARTDLASLRDTLALAHAAHTPLSVTTAYINGGGHNFEVWQAMEAPAFDWLSTWLARGTTTPSRS